MSDEDIDVRTLFEVLYNYMRENQSAYKGFELLIFNKFSNMNTDQFSGYLKTDNLRYVWRKKLVTFSSIQSLICDEKENPVKSIFIRSSFKLISGFLLIFFSF